MTGLVETIWLFVRGGQSVRVIRASTPEGHARLLIYGPGNTQATHEFQDGITCTQRESEIERDLRDALASRIYSGTSEMQRVMTARRLGL